MILQFYYLTERKKNNKKLEREIEFAWDAASELRYESLVVFSLFERGLLKMKKEKITFLTSTSLKFLKIETNSAKWIFFLLLHSNRLQLVILAFYFSLAEIILNDFFIFFITPINYLFLSPFPAFLFKTPKHRDVRETKQKRILL